MALLFLLSFSQNAYTFFGQLKKSQNVAKNVFFMYFESTIVFLLISKKEILKYACLAFHFLFLDEQFDQNGEKSLG